jgi:hypothetical protein
MQAAGLKGVEFTFVVEAFVASELEWIRTRRDIYGSYIVSTGLNNKKISAENPPDPADVLDCPPTTRSLICTLQSVPRQQ